MSSLVEENLKQAIRAVRDRDSELAQSLSDRDNQVDDLERVADLATNIAEDTIYTVEGEIVRHGRG